MSKLTICPHFLLNYSQATPEDIEKEIIFPLYTNIKKAIDNNIEIVLSKEIVQIFQNTYPWNLMTNPTWKGYLHTWHALITQNIVSKCSLVSVTRSSNVNQPGCNHLTSEINDIFIDFLNIFLTRSMPKNKSEEAVFAHLTCGKTLYSYGAFILLDHNDINKIIYPWLRIYKKPLPPTGEYKFIPPSNWRQNPSPIRGNNGGYLDINGHEWTWDMLHQDQWDVQDGTPYTNVLTDGRIR